MVSLRPLQVIVIAASLFASAGALANDLRQRFGSIGIGMTRAEVMTLMPPPAATTETTWLGIPYGQLKWSEGIRGAVFSVNYLGDRVYAKTICDRAADC